MTRRITAVFVALLLAASFASAQDTMQTVLRPDSTVYAITSKPGATLEVSRRRGEVRDTLAVPGTDDDAIESNARLAYDSATGTVFVLWQRSAEGLDEICLAALNSLDEWSDVRVIASGDRVHRAGLRFVLTHARDEGEEAEGDETDATLLHIAWWSMSVNPAPEYAIVAFEKGQHVSTDTSNLLSFAGPSYYPVFATESEPDEAGVPEHPPLAMERTGKFIDVVFGNAGTTKVTRVRLEPKRIAGEARIWRPLGRATTNTPPARLVPLSTSPVQAFVSGDRIVLFTPDAKFRYSVFDGEKWTPVRMIELDEHLTSEHLVQQLRRSVEEAPKQ